MPAPTPASGPATPDFNKLWEEEYLKRFEDAARNNAYLVKNLGMTAEDLLQELWLRVWRRVESTWPRYLAAKKAKGEEPNLNAYVAMLLKKRLIDISRQRDTGPQDFERAHISTDKPVKSEEGDDATIGDFIGALDRALDLADSEVDVENLIANVNDPVVAQTLEIMLSNDLPIEELWRKVRQETGHSRGYIQGRLRANPAVLQFFKDHFPGFHLGKGSPKELPAPTEDQPAGELTVTEGLF